MRVDPLGGASGDMFLAGLVDLGVDLSSLETRLSSLGFDEEFRFRVEKVENRGFFGTRLKVQLKGKSGWEAPEEQHLHHHEHSHGHHHHHDHSHEHKHHHEHSHSHDHHHRHFGDIREMIETSSLPPRVIERAVAVFKTLAESEGRVHGKAPENVHFHEVGAVDSIVDIVGTCLALEDLDVDQLFITAVGVAQGSVKCAHGQLPLPAPATQLMLEGWPVVYHSEEKELCTPTGAALLTTLGVSDGPKGTWVNRGVGMGLSHRTPKQAPPFLRMTLIEQDASESGDVLSDQVFRLSFDIDDMPAEYLAVIRSDLLKEGALDVASTALNMKKGRLGCEVRVLCREEEKNALQEYILKHSTTFGIRVEQIDRLVLPRRMMEVDTPWGKVRVKESSSNRYPKEHIEMEDVISIAHREGLRYEDVLEKVRGALRE